MFDPSLEQQRDEERMRIRLFAQFETGNLSFSRVEQIPWINATFPTWSISAKAFSHIAGL
jgi:hypothetical protein